MPIGLTELQSHVGKSIADLCDHDFTSPSQNHCAHYVSHALDIKLGMLCGSMRFDSRGQGVSIRCDELYNQLPRTGPWDERPSLADGLLIFVTSARNVPGNRMINVPQKHVGIHYAGMVFNFSNNQHKVVADPTVDFFHRKFMAAYAGKDIALFYGVAP